MERMVPTHEAVIHTSHMTRVIPYVAALVYVCSRLDPRFFFSAKHAHLKHVESKPGAAASTTLLAAGTLRGGRLFAVRAQSAKWRMAHPSWTTTQSSLAPTFSASPTTSPGALMIRMLRVGSERRDETGRADGELQLYCVCTL